MKQNLNSRTWQIQRPLAKCPSLEPHDHRGHSQKPACGLGGGRAPSYPPTSLLAGLLPLRAFRRVGGGELRGDAYREAWGVRGRGRATLSRAVRRGGGVVPLSDLASTDFCHPPGRSWQHPPRTIGTLTTCCIPAPHLRGKKGTTCHAPSHRLCWNVARHAVLREHTEKLRQSGGPLRRWILAVKSGGVHKSPTPSSLCHCTSFSSFRSFL